MRCGAGWDGPEVQLDARARSAEALWAAAADRADDADYRGLDGVQKMSKSLGNAIGVHEPAAEMYGKLMSVSDELMWRYWTLLTDLRGSEIAQMQTDVVCGALHPMQAKKNLAWTITRDFHSKEEADAAAEGWAKMFQQRGVE